MTQILLNKKYYSIPQSWNELQPKQLLQVMDVFSKNYPAEQLLLKLLQLLTGMSKYQFLRCNVQEMEEYFYLLVFLLQGNMEFTKNLLPVYQFVPAAGEEKSFYGPADELNNLRFKEFAFTEDYFMAWCDSEKKDQDALNELIAILYRPAPKKYDMERNPEGDFREPFNQNVSSFNAKKYIAIWPPAVKHAIAAWYDGCRRQIVNNNPDVFEGGGGDPARYGLVSVMLNVAEGGVFGDFSKVEDQYVNLVMMQLNETVDKAKKLKAATKS